MKKISFITLNLILLVIIIRQVFIDFESIKYNIIEMLIASLIAIFLMNSLLFISDIISEKLLKYFDQIREKKYNILEWLGDPPPIALYSELSKIKNFGKGSMLENLQKVKGIVLKTYNSIDKLEALRIYLESKVESPKLQTLNTVTYTILIALLTSTGITTINSILQNSTLPKLYLIIFALVWVLLLASISFISKEINKDKLLLKIVNSCIDDCHDRENKVIYYDDF